MTGVSPRRLMEAVAAAQRLIAELPEDEQLKADTLEGETELFELVDRYAERAIAERTLAELAAERAKRFKQQAERSRQVILQILAAIELGAPLKRPLYTASVSHTRRLLITNEADLPPDCFRSVPDRDGIEKALRAGETVPGAELTNPEPTLLLRVR